MKKIKNFAIVAVAALLITSCSKEEINQPTVLDSEYTTDADILNIQAKAIESYRSMGDEEYIRKADIIRQQLVDHKRLTSHDKSLGDPIPLEEIFFLYEGVINSIFTNQKDPGAVTETVESVFDIPVEHGAEGIYIQIADFNTFYTNLINSINAEVNTANNEYLALSDLSLSNIESGFATVTATLIKVIMPSPQMVALYPSGCELAWQWNPLTGVRASDFIKGFVNSTSKLNDPNYCDMVQNTSYNTYYFINFDITTNMPLAAFQGLFNFNPITHIKPYLWRSSTDDCIGDNNDPINNEAIWYGLYSDASFVYNVNLRNAVINAPFISYAPNELEFLYTTLHTSGVESWEPDPTIVYSMGGKGYYGTIICQ